MNTKPRISLSRAIAISLCLVVTGVASPAAAQSEVEIRELDLEAPPADGTGSEQMDTSVESEQLDPARDPRIANKVAVFSGLDKITGRIITFDVYINETVQFGALQVTPRVCYSRDETEQPKTTTFVEVDEITLDRKIRRIFTGWMFADSPGLNAVDHPVYDVWLKNCRMDSDVPPPSATN
ncbi:MAG: hypothetical protein MnENMB40S_15860 [Rhizobiaceae bacterium MnEN-MB40S]|nr:MAG: hypothetical protein MnENMB40S_15860 [Rhizobiaceae bacterium MnEN-MB40S]